MKRVFSKKWILIGLLLLIVAGGFLSERLGLFDYIRDKAVKENESDVLSRIAQTSSTAPTSSTSGTSLVTGQSKVSVVQSDKGSVYDLQYKDIRDMVRRAVELSGGFRELISNNMTVVIKPNLVGMKDFTLPGWQGRPMPTEANGVTTDWRVVKAVVELVREYNPDGTVYVMEGSATGSTRENMEYFKYNSRNIPGVDEFIPIEEDSGNWQDFKSGGIVKVKLPNGLLHKEYYLNRKYKEADVLISVPCLKDHWDAAVSGGIKNVGIGATPASIYGISEDNIGRNNMVNHSSPDGDLHKWIHDFYMCRPVDFVIMDGLQGIQNGPTPSYDQSGTSNLRMDQMNMRLIIAGHDPVAVDTIEALIMQWDPESVGYLKYLAADKAGNLDTSKITVAGKQVDEVRKAFAGVEPIGGGNKYNDTLPPEFSISKSGINSGELELSLEVDEETVKAEIFVDGKLCEPVVTSGFDKISLKLDGLSSGSHKVKVSAFDCFLNRSEKTLEVSEGKVTSVYDSSKLYPAPKAAQAPSVDGLANDACWSSAPWADIRHLWLGVQPTPDSFNGRYKIVWTPQKLYYLVEIKDDILSDVYSNPLSDYYKDDTLEIFLDEDRSGGDHAYSYNAFAYHIASNFNVVDLKTNQQPALFNKHFNIKRTRSGDVYTWEVAVDVYDDRYDENSANNKPVVLKASKELGYALAYCDNDGGDDRDSFIGSVDIPGEDKNVAWQNADVFGTLKLLP